MFGYNLKPWELFGYPLLAVFIALGITNAIPEGWVRDLAKLGYIAICINSAFIGSFYLYHEAAKYVDARTPDTKEERPIQAANALPPIRNNGEIYNQNTLRLKVNAISRFNKILITQRNGNFKVDMSEGFWLKLREGAEETEWKRIGGSGPTEFRNMLERGEAFGAYKRDGGQGKWVVAEWDKIRRLANGEPLPN